MFIKFLKFILALVVALPLIISAGLEGLYWFKINQINPMKIMPEKQMTSFMHDILWVSTGEISEIELVPTSATRFVLGFVNLALSDNNSDPRNVLPKGSILTTLIAREIVYKKNIRGNWHLNNVVVSIWASNQFSATESLDYILNASSYGYGNNNFEDAAEFYFDKVYSKLSFSEVVALIGITKSPSGLSPYCRPDRLAIRGNYIAKNLAEYNPEKYSDLLFKMPEFVSHAEITCN